MTFTKAALGTALTLIAAAAGGWLFERLHLPAAWLTGSMIPVAVLAMVKAPVMLPAAARSPLFLLMGVTMGASFTPETFAGMLKWPASIASLAVTVVALIAASVAFLTLQAKWDRATAFFASVPGALSTVLILAMRSPANTSIVMLAQSFRLFVLIAVLPLVATAVMPPAAAAATTPVFASLGAIAIQTGTGAVLGIVLEKLRFPAGIFVGGMVGSGALHLSGLVSGQMPLEIIIPCQVVLGAFIGVRIGDTDVALIRNALRPSIVAFAIALVISGGAAVAVALWLHLPMGAVLVAFAPGGLEAMAILAFVLGLDPAFVGVHQLARFIGISLLLPVVVKFCIGDGEE